MPLKVGIVGLGYMGQIHLQKLLSFDEVEVVSFEIDEEKQKKIQTSFGVKVLKDFRSYSDSLDGVIVATPSEKHFEIASFFLKQKIPVFVEKPLTTTVEEAEELIRLANEADLTVQVGFVERYNPAFLKALDLIDCPLLFSAQRFGQYLDRSSNLDVVMDLMLHDLDLFRALFKEDLEWVDATGFDYFGSKVDEAYALLGLKGGKFGVFRASRIWGKKERILRIVDREKTIECDLLKREVRLEGNGMSEEFSFHESTDPVTEELRDFLFLIKEKKRPKVTADEALDSLILAKKILERIEGKERT